MLHSNYFFRHKFCFYYQGSGCVKASIKTANTSICSYKSWKSIPEIESRNVLCDLMTIHDWQLVIVRLLASFGLRHVTYFCGTFFVCVISPASQPAFPSPGPLQIYPQLAPLQWLTVLTRRCSTKSWDFLSLSCYVCWTRIKRFHLHLFNFFPSLSHSITYAMRWNGYKTKTPCQPYTKMLKIVWSFRTSPKKELKLQVDDGWLLCNRQRFILSITSKQMVIQK